MTTRLAQQLAFIHEIDKLKYILRKTCLFNSERRENDAEHSWHLCMMVLVLQEYSPEPIDTLKVLKMLLIHDLVEIDAGDTFLYDPARQAQANADAEEAAAQRIFGLLPEDQRDEFYALWQEFETADNANTRFARAIDRMEPLFQNLTNGGGTWKEHEVPLSKVFDRVKGIAAGTPELWDYFLEELPRALASGQIEAGAEPGF